MVGARGHIPDLEAVMLALGQPGMPEVLEQALDRLDADGPPEWWSSKLGLRALLEHATAFASGEWTGGAAPAKRTPRGGAPPARKTHREEMEEAAAILAEFDAKEAAARGAT